MLEGTAYDVETLKPHAHIDQHADDPDGDKLLYEWSARDQENADAGGLLESTEGTSVKLVADVPGSYLISVLVQDGHGGQDRGSYVIVVTEREE